MFCAPEDGQPIGDESEAHRTIIDDRDLRWHNTIVSLSLLFRLPLSSFLYHRSRAPEAETSFAAQIQPLRE
jgi:hypothetical protein